MAPRELLTYIASLDAIHVTAQYNFRKVCEFSSGVSTPENQKYSSEKENSIC